VTAARARWGGSTQRISRALGIFHLISKVWPIDWEALLSGDGTAHTGGWLAGSQASTNCCQLHPARAQELTIFKRHLLQAIQTLLAW